MDTIDLTICKVNVEMIGGKIDKGNHEEFEGSSLLFVIVEYNVNHARIEGESIHYEN